MQPISTWKMMEKLKIIFLPMMWLLKSSYFHLGIIQAIKSFVSFNFFELEWHIRLNLIVSNRKIFFQNYHDNSLWFWEEKENCLCCINFQMKVFIYNLSVIQFLCSNRSKDRWKLFFLELKSLEDRILIQQKELWKLIEWNC
jgi:hypothetical protein